MSLFESRLRVNLDNLIELEKKLKFCEKLRIKNIILEPQNDIIKINNELKQEINDLTSINIYYRINLKIENLKVFKKKIQLYHNYPEIICVESLNPDVQIHAARDSRVDMISYANLKLTKSLSKGVLSLVNQNNSFIEFTLAPIMIENKTLQSKAIRNLYRAIKRTIHSKSNYIISGDFSNIYDLRNPKALISICHTLIGIPLSEARKAFSYNVLNLINRVQNRQDNMIYEKGVRLIKGDKEIG
ncbi:MAG: hypothetical protein KGD63_03290 [Candidatus Lokiarchaeota archaeon]|nr:hypothetical protein [Candidatus Lokiarchaeota archaeon]